jgi:hypothetical protein
MIVLPPPPQKKEKEERFLNILPERDFTLGPSGSVWRER